MTTMRALLVALVLAAIGTQVARAEEVYVRRSNPAGTIARDTIAGGLAGSAVAGGIILYNMGIQDESNYDWQRTLAWGAVVGLGVGLVWGIVDATTGPTYAMTAPRPVRDGNSMTLDLRRRDQSNREMFSLYAHRF
jgi:hypothetical protein